VDTLKELANLLQEGVVSEHEQSLRTAGITEEILRQSPFISQPDFNVFDPSDIEQIFDLYDQHYFNGLLRTALGSVPLDFRLSKRMTKAGGKTSRWALRGTRKPQRYEITISSTLLFESFGSFQRKVHVTGVECQTRLDALLRIMEHEITHLAELISWDETKCSKERFQSIARRMFGHTDHRHNLVSPRERAAKELGLRPGCRVHFRFEGQTLEGIINRITRRATVLVRHPRGEPYSDGNRYQKYYIPVSLLKVVD
jgi:hypothetical protein